MWLTLSLLLLLGPVFVVSKDCELYKLPTAGKCTIDINWKVHSDKQALATCLEYFPTTFVEGKMKGDKTTCTVTAAYQCVNSDHILMYDKCYYFPKTGTDYHKHKISEYVTMDAATKRSTKCDGGKLAVVYSSTHAKFLGMKAHRLGIDKLGIGMTADGKTIDEENGKKSMLHKKMWKLVEGDYVDGEKIVPLKNKEDYPEKAKYLFMRTRTDHVYSRMQGSFERATGDVEVTFACEVPAVFTEEQEWYCDKLGSKGLGLDAVYDHAPLPAIAKPEEAAKKFPRCLYITASKYTYKGDAADMKNIKGCQERPSSLHSTGLDDGTAEHGLYAKFKNKGKLRLAGYKEKKITKEDAVQGKCQAVDKSILEKLQKQWKYLKHNGYVQQSPVSKLFWEDNYPRNECSDFPGESITVGVQNGKKIDMPAEVRAPAVCSIIFFQECESKMVFEGKSPCGDNKSPLDQQLMIECKSTKVYNAVTKGFFECNCPEQHEKSVDPQKGDGCKWKHNKYCAYLKFGSDRASFFAERSDEEERNLQGKHAYFKEDGSEYDVPAFGDEYTTYNDLMNAAVVRDGCRLTVWGAGQGYLPPNFALLSEAKYGTHHVPNEGDGSLAGATVGMGASAVTCKCPGLENKP